VAKRSQSLTNDDIAFAEANAPGPIIGVYLPSGGASVHVAHRTDQLPSRPSRGTGIHPFRDTGLYEQSTNGGDFYFKITAQNTSLGAWRTALASSTGEANIYLAKARHPVPATTSSNPERPGSDGFVVAAPHSTPAKIGIISSTPTPALVDFGNRRTLRRRTSASWPATLPAAVAT
jgi:hypothetical protein